MANVDPNLYALSIQLDLDTGDAYSELDAFGEQIGQIEQDIASAAQKSIGEVSRSATESSKALDKVLTVLSSIKQSGDDVGKSFADAAINADLVPMLDDELVGIKKEYDELKEVFDVWEDIIKVLENKNKLHQDEFDLVEKEKESAKKLSDGFTDVAAAVGTGYYLLNKWADKLARINEDTEKFTATNYRLFGHQRELLNQTRMLSAEYGIFYATALEAMTVLGDLRVPRDELEQYAKMVSMMNRVTNVSIPTIAQYAVRLRQVGRTASQVEEHILKLQENMRKFGLSADAMGKILDAATLSVHDLDLAFEGTGNLEKYTQMKLELTALGKAFGAVGFSANEFDNILADPVGMDKFAAIFGQFPRTVEGFQNAILNAAEDSNSVFQRTAELMKGSAKQAAAARMNLNAYAKAAGLSKSATDYMLTLARHVNDDKSLLKFYKMQQQGAQLTADQEEQFNRVLKARNLDQASVGSYVKQLEEYQKQSGGLLKSEAYRAKAMETAKTGADLYAESMDTLIAQLKILRERFWNLVKVALTPFIKAVAEVVKWLNMMIDVVIKVGNFLYKYLYQPLNWLTGGLLGKFADWIMVGVVVVGLFVLAIGLLAVALMGIPWLLKAIGRAVIYFFKALGKGVAAFARAVGKQAIVLVQLAVAFALVGAGAWMLAQAFKTIADYGWRGVVMFAAFLAIVFAFMVGLVILAAFIQGPIMVGLIVLGAVMLAIGAAAWLVGAAVQMMANAFMTVVIALQKLGQGGVLVDFSIALIVASRNILMAAPILMIASALLIPAASLFLAASVILAAASTAFAFAVWMMGDSGDKFWHAMDGLRKGVEILVALPLSEAFHAILKLIGIGIGLIAAAIPFGIGALAVGAAASVFGNGMLKLSQGFKAIEDLDMDKIQEAMGKILNIFPSTGGAFGWIGDGAKMVKFVASALAFGAAALALGTGLWILAKGAELAATMDLAAVAANLREGVQNLDGVGPALLEAAVPLLPAAWTLFWAGMLLHWGAKGLSKGAELMAGIGDVFIQAGQDMKKGAEELIKAIPLMYKAAVQLFHLAPVLLITGIRLSLAGFWFNLGSIWIAIAVRRLSREGKAFKDFADGMEKLAKGVWAIMLLEPRKIVDLADAMVIAAPKMKKAVKDLDGIGVDFDNALKGLTIGDKDILRLAPLLNELTASLSALDITTDPLEKIASSLDIINQAVIQLDDNIEKLVKDLSDFGPALEQQAEQIELAAARIHDAVENRGVPAMRAAQDAGLAEAQQGDVIATVQVMPHQEGRERNRTQELAEAQNGYLERLVALLETFSGDDAKAIHDLLAATLPGMVDQDGSDLHNNMGQWG